MDNHSLNILSQRIHQNNIQWWIDLNTGEQLNRNVGELLMLAVSELAEALEGHRKNLSDDKLPHRMMFDVEIVDCIIRLFDIAGNYKIDLDTILEEKLAFNLIRPDHQIDTRKTTHGKKY